MIEEKTTKLTAEEWNANYCVGADVLYVPILANLNNNERTTTRSEAWELPSGETVIQVEGKSG